VSYLLAFLGFAALIVLHEFGHFAAAKAVGMRVERFSLFFGPMLLKFRRGETEYGVGPVPLGGYVRITGMNPRERLPEEDKLDDLQARLDQLRRDGGSTDEEHRLEAEISELEARLASGRARAYYAQPVWKRLVVILAGPAMNLLIAFVLILGIFWSQGLVVLHHGQPVVSVGGPLKQPAASYLRPGDRFIRVDGKAYPTDTQLVDAINRHRCAGPVTNGCQASTPVRLLVQRHGQLVSLAIYPRYNASVGRMLVGFSPTSAVRPIGPGVAAGQSVSQMWYVTHTTVSTVVRIFEPKERKQLHGVVGGFKVTQERFAYSTVEALYTLALISLSLAVINLFPFLPLDGGHVFWALAEKVRGKRIPVEVMERAGAVGFALILIIFVIGLSNDISTLTGSGFNVR
jgi:regulator of sigma E protease